MVTVESTEKDTQATGTSGAVSAQSQTEQKTPQQLHEEKIAAASQERKAKPDDSGREGNESKGTLIFGKYKTLEEAEKAHNEAVSGMNEARKKASLYEKTDQTNAVKEVVDGDSDNSIVEQTRKRLVEKLDVREDVADALIDSMQQMINHQFKPVKLSMEKAKVLNVIAGLQEKYEDFDKYAPNVNDMLAAYPKDVRKHINLEHLYLAAKAQDPNLGSTSETTKKTEQETIREMQNGNRTSVISGKSATGSFTAGEHIWTRQEIAQLTPSEYGRYENEIINQSKLGLIK